MSAQLTTPRDLHLKTAFRHRRPGNKALVSNRYREALSYTAVARPKSPAVGPHFWVVGYDKGMALIHHRQKLAASALICKVGKMLSEISSRPKFFSQAVWLADSGASEKALDIIYDGIDALMRSGDIDTVDRITRLADPKSVNIDVCIAVLSCSLPIKRKLKYRVALYELVRDFLIKNGENPDIELAGLH